MALRPVDGTHHARSISKIKCPDCGEVTELYDYLIDKILQAPEPGIPLVEVLSITPGDPNPDPDETLLAKGLVMPGGEVQDDV